jgi:hypothetical protein
VYPVHNCKIAGQGMPLLLFGKALAARLECHSLWRMLKCTRLVLIVCTMNDTMGCTAALVYVERALQGATLEWVLQDEGRSHHSRVACMTQGL